MKVFKNFLMSSSYQLLLVILPVITAPYIARVLQPQGVGTYTFTLANTQYFVLFATLGTSLYGNREIAYHQRDREARSQAFWGITFLSWLTSALALAAFLVFVSLVGQFQQIYLWQGLAILATMFDISWYFMGMEDFKVIVVRNLIFKLLSVIAIFAFVRTPADLPLYVLIMVGSSLLGSLSLWPYLRGQVSRPRLGQLRIGHHLRFTLMLFLPTIAIQVYVIANKTMISLMDSIVHAGFFQQSDTIVKLTLSLAASIGTVMLPHMAQLHSQGKHQQARQTVIRTFNVMTGFSCALCFGIEAVALNFAPLFFGEPFAMVGTIMMIEAPIIIFISWSNVFGTQYLLPLNRMKEYTLSVSLGAVASIVFNFALIPFWGVIGATVATVAAEFAVTAYQFVVIRREFNLRALAHGLWKYFLSGAVMFAVVFYLSQTMPVSALSLLLQVVVGGLIYGLGIVLLKSELFVQAKKILQGRRGRAGSVASAGRAAAVGAAADGRTGGAGPGTPVAGTTAAAAADGVAADGMVDMAGTVDSGAATVGRSATGRSRGRIFVGGQTVIPATTLAEGLAQTVGAEPGDRGGNARGGLEEAEADLGEFIVQFADENPSFNLSQLYTLSEDAPLSLPLLYQPTGDDDGSARGPALVLPSWDLLIAGPRAGSRHRRRVRLPDGTRLRRK